MSCYTYNIILKLFIFGLKYNGLAIMRKTTKLIEGGHRGLQDYKHICYYFYVFNVFYVFFQNPKSRDFLRFLLCFVRFLELWVQL